MFLSFFLFIFDSFHYYFFPHKFFTFIFLIFFFIFTNSADFMEDYYLTEKRKSENNTMDFDMFESTYKTMVKGPVRLFQVSNVLQLFFSQDVSFQFLYQFLDIIINWIYDQVIRHLWTLLIIKNHIYSHMSFPYWCVDNHTHLF